MTVYEVQIGEKGELLMPVEMQAALGVLPGDSIHIIENADGTLFIPKRLIVPHVAERITKLMEEQGVTLAELLDSLDETGEEVFKEYYGEFVPHHP